MTLQERYLARLIFKVNIYQKKGNAFQDFFTSVLSRHDKEFKLVKTHGSNGDKKNDGFVESKGIYYQVYAPENPEEKKEDAIKKCKEDFSGLLAYWNTISPVKEFYFVFNDEYRGAYPIFHETIAEMSSENSGVKIDLLPCNKLEDIFLSLSDEDILSVIGVIPDPTNISSIDYSVLNDAIDFILQKQQSLSADQLLQLPDFSEKIQFNNLSTSTASLLNYASHQVSLLDEYFGANSDFSRRTLQEKFTALYDEAKSKIDTGEETRNDLIFIYILENASPTNNKQIQDAVLVLMSYFFETCDIFERPNNKN